MSLKIDHVNGAYSQLRISGLTVNPSPENIATGLDRLESMMADLEFNRGICIGYNYEENPDPSTVSGVERQDKQMVDTNLAMRLVPDFNKVIPLTLQLQAKQSFSAVSGRVAKEKLRQVQAPSRMPVGSGHRYRERYQRYYNPEQLPPNDCTTNIMVIGEIDNYHEDYTAYLDGETIASFTIVGTTGASIKSSSNTDTMVNYQVEAVNPAQAGTFNKVVITVTTSSGRINVREINFEIVS